MSLSIAKPGSLHEKFLRWVPPSRRYVHVTDKETGDSLLNPQHQGSNNNNNVSNGGRNSNGNGSGRGISRNNAGNNGGRGTNGHFRFLQGSGSSGRNGTSIDSNAAQYSVGDSLRGSGLADHHGGIENTRMRDYDGIRSTVPPHRVLQMLEEKRFYEVLQHHANEKSESGKNFDYFDEVRIEENQDVNKNHRHLYFKEEIARITALLHLKNVANHDEDKLKRLFNAQQGKYIRSEGERASRIWKHCS